MRQYSKWSYSYVLRIYYSWPSQKLSFPQTWKFPWVQNLRKTVLGQVRGGGVNYCDVFLDQKLATGQVDFQHKHGCEGIFLGREVWKHGLELRLGALLLAADLTASSEESGTQLFLTVNRDCLLLAGLIAEIASGKKLLWWHAAESLS